MTNALIYQNVRTGEICNFMMVEKADPKCLNMESEKGAIFVDCDEDAWLCQSDCVPLLHFTPFTSTTNIKEDLYPVVAIDKNHVILMFAFANRLALENTLRTGYAHYYSRSRNKQWQKGEDSGHTQKIHQIFMDQSSGLILYNVDQKKGACHTGYYSCFYRKKTKDGWVIVFPEKMFNPDDVYRK